MQEQKKDNNSNKTIWIAVIVGIVVIIGLVVVFAAGGFGVYWLLKTQTPSPTPTSTISSPIPTINQYQDLELPPSDVVKDFIWFTVGTVTGSSLDYNEAKKLVSYELAQQMNDSTFIPQALCMQQGPDEIKIYSEDISADNMVAQVKVKADWGGDWQIPWEFELINGSTGWKIKEIKCLDTGQVTK